MHWLYVSASTLDGKSAQSTHVLEFCRALVRTHQVTLIAPTTRDFVAPAGITHIPVKLPRYVKGLGFELHMLRYSLLQCAKTKPDIVYVRAGAFNFGALLYARRHNIPCLLEVNGDLCAEYAIHHSVHTSSQYALLRTRLAIYKASLQWSYRTATGIVTVTPGLRDIVVQEYGVNPEHVLVATNGVNPATFIPRDKFVARQQLCLPHDAEIVGFVGTFRAWQGLDTLIEGIKILLPKRPSLYLILIGDGPQRTYLQELGKPCGSHIHFTGLLSHQAVGEWLAACDVFVGPFAPIERNLRTGIAPLKIFEYLALARPVLSSAIPGMEFISHERLGTLFTPGDPFSLATHLAALLDLPQTESQAIGARARCFAEKQCSWDAVVDRVQHFANELTCLKKHGMDCLPLS